MVLFQAQGCRVPSWSVEVIVVPSDGEGGTNPLDLNQLLRRFDVRGE